MTTTARPDATMTIQEAADFLGISRGAAYRAARNGEIPTIRIGRRLLVPTAALQRLLDGSSPAATTHAPAPHPFS